MRGIGLPPIATRSGRLTVVQQFGGLFSLNAWRLTACFEGLRFVMLRVNRP